MTKHFLTLFITCFITSTYTQNKDEQLKTIDEFLTIEYPKDEPGAVVLIARNDTILFEKAYGNRDISEEKSSHS